MKFILNSCLLFLILQFILCAEYSLNNDVNVIRIQNNGSEIRTIYLPKRSGTSSSKTRKYYKKTSNPHDGDKFVLVDHFGIHDYHNKNPNRLTQKQSVPLDIPGQAQNFKNTAIIQKLNSSTIHYEENYKERRKKVPQKNNTIGPIKKSGVEYKVSADKIAKLLNIFTIVNFTNGACYTEDGAVGVCYHASECSLLGGEPHGSCAQGFGVCCIVVRSCGESSVVNNTYVTTSTMSQDLESGVYVCTVTIFKTNPHVVQLRLSFEHFQVAGPVEGDCTIDRFVVTGQNRQNIIPSICGFNTGKHVYIDVEETETPVSLTLLSSGAQGVPRDLRILVSQLTTDNPLHAPRNCLQYYTDPQGSIESFNYIPLNHTTPGVTVGYFNNLNYAICFKKTASLCGIVYSNVAAGGMEYPFEIVNRESDGSSTVPEGQAGAESFDCPDDYIATSTIRLCGYKLNDGTSTVDYTRNSPVIDNTNGPLVLGFFTNQNVTGRGFHLDYMLTPCNSRPGGVTTTAQAIPPAATRSPLLVLD